MPGAKRQRVSNQFNELDGSTNRHFESVDSEYNPASEATDLFQNTGPSGRRALNGLTDTDGEAADVLLRMDDAATQRRFARAYDRGEVDSDELATAVKRYDDLDSSEKAEFDEMLARNGDDAADFAGRTDSDTFDAVLSPCGGRRASSLGGVGTLRSDQYYSVAGPSSALVQSGGSCPDLPNDLEDGLREHLVDLDWSKLDDGDLEAADVRRMRELLESGEMDQADVRRLTEILESKDENPLVDGELTGSDLTDVADAADLSDARILVKKDGDVIRVNRGNKESGLQHIEGRHIDGDIVRRQAANGKESGAASFFPTGRTIEVDGKSNSLPNEMTDKEVRELIYTTIEESAGESGRGSRVQYTLEPEDYDGIDRVKVIVKPDGAVKTAYPKSGSAVERWAFGISDWV